MSADNLPLPMLQVIRKGQGKQVTADAALKVMMPVGDMVDEIRKGTADAQGLFALLEFFTFIYGAYVEAMAKATKESRPLLEERCADIAKAANLTHELLLKVKAGGRAACNLQQLDCIDKAYSIAVNAHEALPEWVFIKAYRHQEAFMRRKK